MSELVTIAVYHDPAQAVLARAALEGSGMYCFLYGEHLAATRSLYGLTQGVEVRVRAEDAEAAVELLGLDCRTPELPPCCPQCGGEPEEITGKRLLVVLLLLCALVPGFTVRKKYRCRSCGFVWK